MPFWSSDTIGQRAETVIHPFDPLRIKHGAYELSMGPEAFATSDPDHAKTVLEPNEHFVLPPGQFGLLLTEEMITIPLDIMGFISIKAGIKFRGLINVSGFHVDPGFHGRLIFAVYNAGSQSIRVARGQPLFLLWFGSMDAPCPPHDGEHAGQHDLSPEIITRIQGTVASPAELKKMIDEMKSDYDKRLTIAENRITTWQGIAITLSTITIGLLASMIFLFLRYIAR